MSPTAPSVLSSKYRSPSYFRRQVRRREARASQNVMIDPLKSNEDVKEGSFVNTHDRSKDKSEDTANPYNCDVAAEAIGDAMLVNNAINENNTEEVEANTVDKLVDEFVIRVVTEPMDKKEVVEQDIKENFSLLGVKIQRLNSFSNVNGFFEMCRVKTSPINLKKVQGSRLGVKNCSVNAYEPQKSCN